VATFRVYIRLTSTTELQNQYGNYKGTLQQLASKIGDVEQEADEHRSVTNPRLLEHSSPHRSEIPLRMEGGGIVAASIIRSAGSASLLAAFVECGCSFHQPDYSTHESLFLLDANS
jgi:hypothetical protein